MMQHTSQLAQYATRYGRKLQFFKRDNPTGTKYSAPRPAGTKCYKNAAEAEAARLSYAKPITKH